MYESRLSLRPGGAVQFEAVFKGFIDRFDLLEEFSEKNSLFRRRRVYSLMSGQSSTRSNLLVGQKEIPFSSRLDCVTESFMLDKLNTVDIFVCLLKCMEGFLLVKKSGMIF